MDVLPLRLVEAVFPVAVAQLVHVVPLPKYPVSQICASQAAQDAPDGVQTSSSAFAAFETMQPIRTIKDMYFISMMANNLLCI
jgi:hypothetical protein